MYACSLLCVYFMMVISSIIIQILLEDYIQLIDGKALSADDKG